jgi:peroxiredoxin
MKNPGREYRGIERAGVLIDKDGVVREIRRKVKLNGRVEAVPEAARAP